MKYDVKLRPLSGKYYGTILDVTSDAGEWEIKLWDQDMTDEEPSTRQLGDDPVLESNHWENQATLELAGDIISGLNCLYDYRDRYANGIKR